jgi:hypothetical protein
LCQDMQRRLSFVFVALSPWPSLSSFTVSGVV